MTGHLKKVFQVAMAGMTGLLAGCAAVGPTDNPVLRSLTWERYIGGDDLARACVPDQPPRYRLVYNAVATEQQRTYDITGLSEGGALVETRVIGQPVINDPRNPITLQNPFAPWTGKKAVQRIDATELAKLVAALDASGFEGPAPDGLFLRADSFFWTASACRNGQFHFYAWSAEAPGFNPVAERLLGAVAAVDDSGIPPIHPHTVALPPYGSYFANPRPDQPDYTPLRFQVGKNGLRYSQGTIN